jgi:hypothetical protein
MKELFRVRVQYASKGSSAERPTNGLYLFYLYPVLIWSRLPNNLYAKINTISHKFVIGKIPKLKE